MALWFKGLKKTATSNDRKLAQISPLGLTLDRPLHAHWSHSLSVANVLIAVSRNTLSERELLADSGRLSNRLDLAGFTPS
jgi:hypothetical protein